MVQIAKVKVATAIPAVRSSNGSISVRSAGQTSDAVTYALLTKKPDGVRTNTVRGHEYEYGGDGTLADVGVFSCDRLCVG